MRMRISARDVSRKRVYWVLNRVVDAGSAVCKGGPNIVYPTAVEH